MTTTHSVLRDLLFTSFRSSSVATAAGVSFGTWSSTTSARVVEGDETSGLILNLSRGRLPMVELWQGLSEFDPRSYDGGPEVTTWHARAHSGLRLPSDAGDRCQAILRAGIAALRATQRGLFPGKGDTIGEVKQTEIGFSVDAVFRVANTFALNDYGGDDAASAGAEDPAGPTGDGLTVDVSYGDAASVVYTVPATRALDEIEVYVVTPWNGTGAGIRIGLAGDLDRYFAVADSDITSAADDAYLRNFAEQGPLAILVTPVPGTGATAGKVRLQIKTTANS